jgi:hypothetical protein
MFGKRNKAGKDVANACPYCEYSNAENAESCSQCYYVFAASARDQPIPEPSTSGSDLMSLLLSDEMESPDEDDYAVEAVLTLEDAAVEISQYETANEDDSFQFIGGGSPTLAKTVDYVKPEEVELQVSDAPTTPSNFEIGTYDPLQEVAEPIHTGLGNLYSPMVKTETDDDLLGSVGPKASVPMTPDIPDIPDIIPSKGGLAATMHKPISPPTPTPLPSAAPSEKMATPIPQIPKAKTQPISPPTSPVTAEVPKVEKVVTPQLPIEEEKREEVVEQVTEKPAPIPQTNGRIWPWPAKDEWNAAQVYREVVTALEQVKSGNLNEAAKTLDNLGPHLSENLDMLLHIGIIMRYLGRSEHLQWTLAMAQRTYPNNEHVSSALARL